MKQIIIALLIMLFGFTASAKTDYQNPVESVNVATLAIYPTENRSVKRDMFICTDKYDNSYISINVNYFVKKGKDKLNITLNNGDSFTLELGKSFKQLKYQFYPENPTYRATTLINRLGNTVTATTTVTKTKYNYYDFYSAYPLTPEQLEGIIEVGIKEITVEGIYKIIIQ